MAQAPSYQNLILSRLSKSDFQLLEPHLEPADLPRAQGAWSGVASRSKPSIFPKRVLPPSWPTAIRVPSRLA